MWDSHHDGTQTDTTVGVQKQIFKQLQETQAARAEAGMELLFPPVGTEGSGHERDFENHSIADIHEKLLVAHPELANSSTKTKESIAAADHLHDGM